MHGEEPTAVLVGRWRGGDEAAAAALFARFARRLRQLAARRLRGPLRRRVEADDITQSVFRTFFRRVRQGEYCIDRPDALWSLLAQIAVNKVYQQAAYHGARRRNVAAEVPLSTEHPAAWFEEPSAADTAALAEEIQTALADCDADELEVFRLCMEGESQAEAARRLGLSRATVRRIVERLRRLLRARLGARS